MRWSSSTQTERSFAQPTLPIQRVEAFIRPYSLEVVAKLDRVVTGSDEMPPATGNSHVVQVWRLSDLKLLKTIVLPKAPHSDAVPQNAAEPRLLADGQTVVVATSGCGLYRINDLGGTNPSAQWIYDFGARTCGVPTVVGNYWVEAITSAHSVMSLDMRDSANPLEAGRIAFKGLAFPHWISHEPGGTASPSRVSVGSRPTSFLRRSM